MNNCQFWYSVVKKASATKRQSIHHIGILLNPVSEAIPLRTPEQRGRKRQKAASTPTAFFFLYTIFLLNYYSQKVVLLNTNFFLIIKTIYKRNNICFLKKHKTV